MLELKRYTTEKRNPRSMDLDAKSPQEIVRLMNQEDRKVITAIKKQVDQIALVATWGTEALYKKGRIIYLGAGTSGRLGVLDAVECPPTFGVDPDCVVGLMAGGEGAFVKAKEGAEDREDFGEDDLKAINLKKRDLVIGIAASGRTPYVVGGLRYAQGLGCKTAAIASNAQSIIGQHADVQIEVITGPEVLTGSTRLKAGTAQKMILNMISTTAMIGFGKCYQNLMVDLKATNEKLVVRSQNIVMQATGVDREQAKRALNDSAGSVKAAIVMILFECSFDEAKAALKRAKGHIRRIGEET